MIDWSKINKMKWLYLFMAIISEVCGTTSMKLSEGLSKITFSAIMLFFYMLSLIFLSMSLKQLEIGIAYAIWSGIGIALITFIGVVFFKEQFSILKLMFILFIIIGVIGLNFSSKMH